MRTPRTFIGTACFALAFFAGQSNATLQFADYPAFESVSYPPMNMLVMGRDRTLYNEAYNDASDLTGNGAPDIGYKPDEIDYYGYFDSYKCYTHDSGVFRPAGTTADKQCSGQWSGDFLNYVTTARIDALRKVLYGGKRAVDETGETILERTYIPQDAHGWAKDYRSAALDGYDIARYTPLSAPSAGRSHVFASVSLNSAPERPLLRVMQNFQNRDGSGAGRSWEWASIESPVLGDRCFDGSDGPDCSAHASRIDDYTVRVEVCNSSFPEANCSAYGANFKPEGLLQQYGATGRMEFGLISGSYLRNTSGGVLRKAMGFLDDEVNPATGQFTDVQGIIRTIDTFRIVDFTSDNNYHPGWPGAWFTDRPMTDGEIADWGNPVGEMVYESVRYFAGRSSPTAQFVPPLTGGAEQVTVRLGDDLELPVADWDDPYENRPWCTKGAQLIISNPNTSFDTDQVPGSAFSGFSGDLPGLDAAAQGAAIWSAEGSPSGNRHFIGQAGAQYDGAPTVKTVTSLGNIRGIAPEEPTKEGGYYAASVARHAYMTDLRPDIDEGSINLQTFSVALASPLPKIEFPTAGGLVSLVPFGKVVQADGCPASLVVDPREGQFQPMAQIVDFYIDEWANTHPENQNNAVNGGRPYARFRINYEDVEQGADHDMDSIVGYEILVNPTGEVVVNVAPEYVPSAGCLRMNFGYVISGVSTPDGVPGDGLYLEVRGHWAGDTSGYFLNTPPGLLPGACAGSTPPAACAAPLPPDPFETFSGATRTFIPSGTQAATVLPDPLWYAAKYGAEGNDNLAPGQDPDNYFLVTNAATLAEQLETAFRRILDLASPTGLAASSSRLETGTLLFQASFESEFWSGMVEAIDPESGERSEASLPPTRNVFTSSPAGDRYAFDTSLPTELKDRVAAGENDADRIDAMIDYILGDRTHEGTGHDFRERHPDTVLGDIVNSPIVFAGKRNEGWAQLDDTYGAYLAWKHDQNDYDLIFVGANDGMLHAFNAQVNEDGSLPANLLTERFAYIPHTVLNGLREYVEPGYGHRFYVDGRISVADAAIGDCDNGPDSGLWCNVLVGTLGAGGRGVYALDVTNRSNPRVLWEINADNPDFADLGRTFSQPLITRIRSGTDTFQWVAIFGNGYLSGHNEPSLYIVDLASGNLLHRIAVPVEGEDGSSNGLSSPSLVLNATNSSYAIRAYAGDLNGNVWRFDLLNPGSGTAVTRLFQDPDHNPITAAPELALHPAGGTMVFVGTGKMFEVHDPVVHPTDEPIQTFYALRDRGSELSADDLATSTMSTLPDGDGLRTIVNDENAANGWQLDLHVGAGPGEGERALARPIVTIGQVIFETFQPDEDSCQGGGTRRAYRMNALSGTGENFAIIDNVAPPTSPPVIMIRPPMAGGTAGDGYAPGSAPGDDGVPDFNPDSAPAGQRNEWCSEIGVQYDEQFVSFGSLCEGRQVWRQTH